MALERCKLPRGIGILLVVSFAVWLATTAAQAADDLAGRRSLVASMSVEQQQELLQKQERFAALPQAEQDRLRQLQAAVDAQPDSQQLHEVLVRYHEWLKTLSPNQRAELADLPAEERVERIKKIQQMQQKMRQQAERAKLLTRDDIRAVANWGRQIVWEHRDALLKDVPDEFRERLDRADLQKQRDILLFYAMNHFRGRNGPRPLAAISPTNIDQLAEKLSPEPLRELTEAPTLDAKRVIARGWVWAAVHRLAPKGPRGSTPGMDEEVVRFFEHELPPAFRQGLLNKPNELTRDELRRLYLERGHAGPNSSGEGAQQDSSGAGKGDTK